MLRYALRRVLGLIPTLWAIVTLSFLLMRLAPGGPFDQQKEVPPEIKRNLEAKYHLDEPLWKQYVEYIDQLLHGDLGPSFKYRGRTVGELIRVGFPVSLELGLASLAWSLLFGVIAGILGAWFQNRGLDHAAMAGALLGICVPNFVLGPLLILVFSLTLSWLPPGRWGGVSHLLLPSIALGAAYAAYVARLARAGLVEVIRLDFIRTARAKGLSGFKVLVKHALPTGLMPVLSFIGPALAGLATGSVVVERIFDIPGMGRYFVDGALNRDYTLVLGVVIVDSACLLLANLLVDLCYGALDPRIRYQP